MDVADAASISGLAWQLDGEKIDLALYVAGVLRRPNALTPPTQQDFDAVMHTNVLGAMQTLPQVAPLVAEARGVFAFLSSSMSQIGSVPDSSAWLYRTSKAALNMAVAAAQHAGHVGGQVDLLAIELPGQAADAGRVGHVHGEGLGTQGLDARAAIGVAHGGDDAAAGFAVLAHELQADAAGRADDKNSAHFLNLTNL